MIYQSREDSYLLEKSVVKYCKGKSVLDMGTGSGIQSMSALNNGASSVLAVDINPKAVKHAILIGLSALKSNLFSKVKGKFDLIVCNPPYLPEDEREDSESATITSGGKRGDEFICKFLSEAKNHLNKEGIILLLLSSITPKDKIDKIIAANKWKKSVIDSEKMSFEELEVWVIE